MVIAGACTGTDAHTVGIDAIMNMKGFPTATSGRRARRAPRLIIWEAMFLTKSW